MYRHNSIYTHNSMYTHNSILILMKSGAPFFRIDMIYMIYLDVNYFLVVCLSIYQEKHAVKKFRPSSDLKSGNLDFELNKIYIL